MNTITRILQTAIQIEEAGNVFYSHYAAEFPEEPAIKEVLEQLSTDEEAHKGQFEKWLNEEQSPAGLQEEDKMLMEAIDPLRFFDVLKGIERPTSRDVLACAFQFEKDTVLYYYFLEEIAGSSPELSRIIATEKQHVNRLFKILVSEGKFRGLSDTWP